MDNMRWSLDTLYTSFDSEEFREDLKRCDEYIKNIKEWVKNNLSTKDDPVEKIEEFIKIQNEFYSLFSKLSAYTELTLSVEAKNEKALRTSDILYGKIPELTEPTSTFKKWVGSLEDIDNIIEASELLKEHRFYLKEIVRRSKYLLSDKEEVIIAKMKNTGSNAWSKLQNLLSSTLLVDITIDGEEKHLPLPVVRNMAYDKNPEVRKSAYYAELKAYEKIEESSAACLNGIKGEVITISKLRGYNSVLEKTLMDSRMDKETLDAMLSAMRESLPYFHRYYRKKAEILGHKNGLPFYDLFAPVGEADMRFTFEEARDFIVNSFKGFSKRLSDYVKNAFDKRWIDAEPREGKRGGAFCYNLHPIKESRILSNFTGSFNDVSTLAHELGHGYHGACLVNESFLNSDYPMPLAETASIFNETIIKNAALKEAGKEEALTILESDISSSGQVIVDIYSRFLFESELFRRREEGALSVNELKEMMLNAQKEAYGDGLDHNYLHPYMWINKPHYYYAEANFYNFPYAFGLLFAKGLYAEYLKRGEEFVESYDNLLAATGKNSIADVAAMMNIDVHSIDFWRSSLKVIEEDIEKFISLT
ncbi:pepF/M3 family oligoendopeptidase [Fonticella tunisiensis]|uniref:PepF/M3 family oligoendopeptidase n=2 Tax=Fonticella tunisiensis TaxID=1096341 RepID=A0A4R7KVD3_9CLOT|nr:M3 family oligoendopeptidase [Fonticella tunisiensis]TDT62333.1 pepF/M3 family oligoendopeptidase [Fonticella tunisiensis]